MTMSKELLIIKLKATAIHFSLSIVVFVVLAYLILYHWYPQPYFTIDGGWPCQVWSEGWTDRAASLRSRWEALKKEHSLCRKARRPSALHLVMPHLSRELEARSPRGTSAGVRWRPR